MEILIDNREFEWDDDKAELNWKKHGIKFETAAKVFGDENRIEEFDYLHSDYEDRWKVIGMVDKLLFVVYTERSERLRLISAREATVQEKRRYYVGEKNY